MPEDQATCRHCERPAPVIASAAWRNRHCERSAAIHDLLDCHVASRLAKTSRCCGCKLESKLGWKPAETFDTGIRKTVQWYLHNPDWVAHVQSDAYCNWVQKQHANTSSSSQ